MAFDKTNTFTLSKNKKKETDQHPDYTGSLNVGGQEYWLNAWKKEGKDGPWLSGKVKAKDSKPKQQDDGF